MATLQFGTTSKTSGDYVKEIQEVLGVECPISVSVINGVLKHVSVETEWKEGGTTPIEAEVEIEKTIFVDGVREEVVEVELIDDATGEPLKLEDGSPAKQTQVVEVPYQRPEKVTVKEMRVVDYEENYEEKSLTQEQIDNLNTYISENVQQ